jgi:oxygen-dependent protoporphyrinogen oxidase
VKTVAIVGGGISGLALAHALLGRGARERGIEVRILEKAARPGGNIRTEAVDGYLCEWGPNGFLDNAPATLALVRDVGLGKELQPSDERARRRYVFRRGRLHLLPGTPGQFLASGLLSGPGKLRIAFEPISRRRPPGDETIHAFAARRIGREAADVLIDAMVSGVFAGDARALSLRACFPAMWQMETHHGGLFRALLARIRAGRRRKGEAIGSPLGRLTSFRGGTEELVRALARALGGALVTSAPVSAVTKTTKGYRLEGETPLEAASVVLAGGAAASARVVQGLDADLAAALGEIRSAPLAVVCLGYEESRLPRPLDGFGFLVPRGEGPRLLGALWDSSIYPGRAPEGRVLLRAMIGGAHDPRAVELDDESLLAVVRGDLRATMGLEIEPVFTRAFRHPLGIPQYTVGHLDRLARIERRLERHPGLYAAGNSYRGVAINSCVAEAGPLAERILARL